MSHIQLELAFGLGGSFLLARFRFVVEALNTISYPSLV